MFHLISNIAAGLVVHEATQAAHRSTDKPQRIQRIQDDIARRRAYRDAQLEQIRRRRAQR